MDIFLNLCAYIITLDIGSIIIDYSKMKRLSKIKKITKIKKRPDLLSKYNKLDIEKALNQLNNQKINYFDKKIKENIPEESLTIYHNNLITLKSNKNKNFKLKNIILKNNAVASYAPRTNTIDISKNHEDCIYHELFHMASSCINNNCVYSGFNQTILPFNIGEGINEGYTEILAKRYFGYIHNIGLSSHSYPIEEFFAHKLESIVGTSKMEELYFNSDLLGLIEELKSYDSEENIMKFISDVDFLCEYMYSETKLPTKTKLIQNKLQYVSLFLTKTYIKMLQNKLTQNECDKRQLERNLYFWFTDIVKKIKIDDNEYNLLPKEDLDNILSTNIISEDTKNSTFKYINQNKKITKIK